MTPHHTFDLLLLWYRNYLTVNGYRPRTITDYLYELSLFRCFIAEETTASDIDEVTKEMISAFIAHLYQRKRAASTIAHKSAVLKAFFSVLYRENMLYRDLSAAVPKTKKRRTVPAGILTELETDMLFEYLERESGITPISTYQQASFFRDRTMIEILYSTGMRKAELLKLTVQDLNFTNEIIFIYNGKGGKDRVVPMGRTAAAILETYIHEVRPLLITATSEDFLFPSKKGGHLSEGALSDMIRRYCKNAGITKRVRVHDFRHACATHMLNRGADIRFVQELLGHSSLRSTQIYTHIALNRLKEVHNRFHPRERWTI